MSEAVKITIDDLTAAAAELRRLHALNAELVEALQGMIDCCPETRGTHNPHLAMARAALAKVEASK